MLYHKDIPSCLKIFEKKIIQNVTLHHKGEGNLDLWVMYLMKILVCSKSNMFPSSNSCLQLIRQVKPSLLTCQLPVLTKGEYCEKAGPLNTDIFFRFRPFPSWNCANCEMLDGIPSWVEQSRYRFDIDGSDGQTDSEWSMRRSRSFRLQTCTPYAWCSAFTYCRLPIVTYQLSFILSFTVIRHVAFSVASRHRQEDFTEDIDLLGAYQCVSGTVQSSNSCPSKRR